MEFSEMRDRLVYMENHFKGLIELLDLLEKETDKLKIEVMKRQIQENIEGLDGHYMGCKFSRLANEIDGQSEDGWDDEFDNAYDEMMDITDKMDTLKMAKYFRRVVVF